MTDFVRFYAGYDEEGRLQRHRTEFAVTTFVLDRLVTARDRILDIGAGTGTYSVHFASMGCSVVAVDAVASHVATLRANLESLPTLDVQALVGDARDLSAFAEHDFDMVLCMGPVYHASDPDAQACLGGCVAALRPDGLLVVSYVNRFQGHEDHEYAGEFVHRSFVEIEKLLARYDLTQIYHGPADGAVFRELNVLAQDEAQRLPDLHAWLDQNPNVFENDDWRDTSQHGLYVGRKA